ncbi:hypothetical protein FNF31_07257 [Cafeteria roenbergensis]|uniref:ribose-5-phosphate isomerase n=1 Tax=Cafeteria roenbergensis TaxID=33653 RepID=A0A5A8C9E9_CAFRO|nr:hypothetical protein FNF31_07257 [Cafeteria roenbergensis]KAA0163046.1 hypothetical protein FNF28_04436 [Cafeteria roenbergensis]
MAAAAMDPVEAAKRAAAEKAVDEFVRDGMVVGIGSGSTIVYAVHRLAARAKLPEGDPLRISTAVFVPTSFQSRQLLAEAGLTVAELATREVLDVAIDGADEVDKSLNCIKGGGGCQLEEKLVASAARKFVVVADHRKQSERLGTCWTKGVPLEIAPSGYRLAMRLLAAKGATATLRMAKSKAGPVVTDGGHFVVDAHFGGIEDVPAMERWLKAVPGVLETGIFCGMASKAFFGQADGSVVEWAADGNATPVAAAEAGPESA